MANPGRIARVFAACIAQTLIFSLLIRFVFPHTPSPEGLQYIIAALVAMIPLIALCGTATLRSALATSTMPKPTRWLTHLSLVLTCSMVIGTLAALVHRQLGRADVHPVSSIDSLAVWSVLYVCLLGPIIEELTYRGYVMRALLPFGPAPAIAVTSVLFGLSHHDPAQGLAAGCAGVVYALAAHRYSLRYAIVLHILNNTFAQLFPHLTELGTPVAAVLVLIILAATVTTIVVLTRAAIQRSKRRRVAPNAQGAASAEAGVLQGPANAGDQAATREASGDEGRDARSWTAFPMIWAALIVEFVFLVLSETHVL